MFKFVLTACLWATVFLLSSAHVWSEDMEDRFFSAGTGTGLTDSKNISIDVKAASLIDVLKIISQQTGLSFVAADDVADKKITIYLNKIPLDRALQTILDANGMTYEMQEDTNVFIVEKGTSKHLITKVYQLKYATVFSSPLNSTISLGSSGSGSSSSTTSSMPAPAASAPSAGGASSAAGGSAAAAAPATGGLEAVLQDSLSPDGKVVEDARTNSLIITDKPGQFTIIDSTVAKLDVPIPQVLIEVEMVDVSKSVADQLGITWGATPITFTGGSKVVNYPFSTSDPNGSSTSGSSTVSSSGGKYTPGDFSATGLTAELNFLTTNTDARTLARPRILTLNNQTAQIEISTDQAISVEPSSTSTSSSSGGSSIATNTVERATTGVILKVTPQANLVTREITMAISPKVIDIILSQVQAPGGSKIFDPETRGSDSMLKLHDGQSMVIGGLLRNETDNTVTKLPVLGDLPLIGAAFRSRVTQKTERELLIFITPHIIDDPNEPVLKDDGSQISAQADSDLQDTSDHSQGYDSNSNSYGRNE